MSGSSDSAREPAPGCCLRGRTLVLSAGNPGAGDDGFGPAVLRILAEKELPAGVSLADGGIQGVDLLADLEEIGRLILIDAIRVTGRSAPAVVGDRSLGLATGRCGDWDDRPDPVPGGVVVFRLSEVELDDPDPRFSLHDLSLGGAFRLARVLKLPLPEIIVVGFALSSISSLEGPSLSPTAQAAVPAAVLAVRSILVQN
jgi:Ni,Fe-hydrogenase maturation factor